MSRHVLEAAAQAFADATSQPPFLYELGPEGARKVLDDVQAAPIAKLPISEKWLTVPAEVGDVRVRIVKPPDVTGALPTILYMHGGGWVLGNADTHDRLVRELAVGVNAAVVFVEYDRSPEARYPVAIEQGYATARWITQHGLTEDLDATRLAVAGDSVGGNMTAALTILAKQRGDVTFVHQSMFYPVTDAGQDTESYLEFADGPFLTAKAMAWFWDAYAPDMAMRKPISHVSHSRDSVSALPTTRLGSACCVRPTPSRKAAVMTEQQPTVVLVHGAFAESASWNGVIELLQAEQVNVIAVANPLRSLSGDAAYVRDVIASLGKPVVLVGHSYGGMVITQASAGNDAVAALVYVCAFAPEQGESAFSLSMRFPGSTLGDALTAYPVSTGGNEFAIRQDLYHQQFAADVSDAAAAVMAVTQRPATEAALSEPLPTDAPGWKTIPSWFAIGAADRNIPAELQRFEAQRSGARGVREVAGGSHALSVSDPAAVAETILDAVRATARQLSATG